MWPCLSGDPQSPSYEQTAVAPYRSGGHPVLRAWTGDVYPVKGRDGKDYLRQNEASQLLNAVESQFRQNMKE